MTSMDTTEPSMQRHLHTRTLAQPRCCRCRAQACMVKSMVKIQHTRRRRHSTPDGNGTAHPTATAQHTRRQRHKPAMTPRSTAMVTTQQRHGMARHGTAYQWQRHGRATARHGAAQRRCCIAQQWRRSARHIKAWHGVARHVLHFLLPAVPTERKSTFVLPWSWHRGP